MWGWEQSFESSCPFPRKDRTASAGIIERVERVPARQRTSYVSARGGALTAHGDSYGVSKIVHGLLSQCQSGVEVYEHQSDLNQLKRQIRSLYQDNTPPDAIESISRIWNEVDSVASLAEARMSSLLRKLPPPKVQALDAHTQQWIHCALESLDDDRAENPIHPRLRHTTKSLLEFVVEQYRDLGSIRVEAWCNGRILLEFGGARTDLQWILSNSELPWPGVNITAINYRGRAEGRSTRIHTLEQAIASLKDHSTAG